MTSALLFALLAVFGARLADSSPLATATLPPLMTVQSGCTYENKWYPEGGKNDNPCQPCTCYQGRMICAVVDCFFPPPCVDQVVKPGQCCPSCPNGPNCRAPDGTIISANQTVNIDTTTTCRCSHQHGGFFMQNNAICTTMVDKPLAVS